MREAVEMKFEELKLCADEEMVVTEDLRVRCPIAYNDHGSLRTDCPRGVESLQAAGVDMTVVSFLQGVAAELIL